MKIATVSTIAFLFCAGCSSTGWHGTAAKLPESKLICVQSMDSRFAPQLVPLFQSRGFTVISTNSPYAMTCRTSCGGGFGMTAEVSLWKDGKMLVKGSGSNAGWGNWLARGAASQDMIARAAEALDRELAKMENGEPGSPAPTGPRTLSSPKQ